MTILEINKLERKCKPGRLGEVIYETRADEFWWLENQLRKMVRISKGRQVTRRGLSYSITADVMFEMATAQDFRCALSGIEFDRPYMDKSRRRNPFSVSIDRIDCSIGYERENVRLVCLIVNLARSDFGDEAVIKFAHAVASRHINAPLIVPCAPSV